MIDNLLLGVGGSKLTWSGPGPEELVSGNPEAGYFGDVPAEEFLSTSELKNKLPALSNLSTTTNSPTWLKFSYGEKTLFIPKDLLFLNVSWDYLYLNGLIYGEDGSGAVHNGDTFNQLTTVKFGSQEFIVRTMGTDVENPSTLSKNTTTTYDTTIHYGEWVDLLYRVCSYQVVNYPTEKWATYSPNELMLNHWNICRETTAFDHTRHIVRGGNSSRSDYVHNGYKSTPYSWRPVLELMERNPPPKKILFTHLSVDGFIVPPSGEDVIYENALERLNSFKVEPDFIVPPSGEDIIYENALESLNSFKVEPEFIIEPANENSLPVNQLIQLDGFIPSSSSILEPSGENPLMTDSLEPLDGFNMTNEVLIEPSDVKITIKEN